MTATTSNCAHCGKPLAGRKNKRFCNSSCSRAWHSEQWHAHNPKTHAAQLATGTVGSVNLMRVMLDLVVRGYNVYRAAFEAMPYELWIQRGEYGVGGWPFGMRVKVTTGHRLSSGKLQRRKFDGIDFDVEAVVVGNDIIYDPPL